MLGRSVFKLMQRNANPKFCMPKRNWAQVGMVVATPARVKVSYLETLLHVAFMYVVWLSPVAYFLTQLKVWRREYIQEQ